MKFRALLVGLMIVMVCLGGCGKKKRIEGTVYDVFGNPLKDVTVKIEKTTFTAITDNSGHYSLEYAPGPIKLIFSKDGYTTMSLNLNIQQKVHYPAEPVVLYPIPKDSGMFYIDFERKQLVKIEPNCKVVVTKTQNQGYLLPTWNYHYSVKCSNPAITIKPGKAQFIDKIPHYGINIFRVNKNGIIFDADLVNLSPMGGMDIDRVKHSGFIKDSFSELGKEGLLVRTVDLSPGSYAWVEMFNTGDSVIPKEDGFAIGFKVGGASAN